MINGEKLSKLIVILNEANMDFYLCVKFGLPQIFINNPDINYHDICYNTESPEINYNLINKIHNEIGLKVLAFSYSGVDNIGLQIDKIFPENSYLFELKDLINDINCFEQPKNITNFTDYVAEYFDLIISF